MLCNDRISSHTGGVDLRNAYIYNPITLDFLRYFLKTDISVQNFNLKDPYSVTGILS